MGNKLLIGCLAACLGASAPGDAATVTLAQDGKAVLSIWSKDKPTAKYNLTNDKYEVITAVGEWPKEGTDAVESPPPLDVLGNPETPPKPGQKHWSLTLSRIPTIIQTGQEDGEVVFSNVKDVSWDAYEFGIKLSQMDFESTSQDVLTGRYQLDNIFGVLYDNRGYSDVVIPLLMGDTNGDGELGGPGDLLYGLVDLRLYLAGVPEFDAGQVFPIQGGTAAGLPGLMFSTTPFVFNDVTGFTGTFYTGSAYVAGEQTLSAIPEPTMWAPALVALSAMFIQRRRFTFRFRA